MTKKFNVNGRCSLQMHYMVNMKSQLDEMKNLVDEGNYFVMNRARQYGKTTTMNLLAEKLTSSYMVFLISFEGMADAAYASESSFCKRIAGLLCDTIDYGEVVGVPDDVRNECYQMSLPETRGIDFRVLSNFVSKLCKRAKKPIVFMVDEVDQAGNQEIFLAFLGMLRDKYLNRDRRATFQSVILAGVYDIKNLKLKIRKESEHQYNSPWNIASNFTMDMSFSAKDIENMLEEYKVANNISMDVTSIAEWIYEYTAGYPYLVSAICKTMDEQIAGMDRFERKQDTWTRQGFLEAVKYILKTPNTLFDDMIKQLTEYPELSRMLQNILFNGQDYPYNPYNKEINIGTMFGFVTENDGRVIISNRIFETHLYNYFISEEISKNTIRRMKAPDKSQFIKDGFLNMDLIMEKFAEHFTELYDAEDTKFVQEYGRKIFLLYLKPIINGTGNYYIEAQTRNQSRTDVIVDYLGRQYVVELKIWHGSEYNRKGEEQLMRYLEEYHLDKGYMLTFNFNKNKEMSIQEVEYNGKILFEVIV